jgi:hypothetical protein
VPTFADIEVVRMLGGGYLLLHATVFGEQDKTKLSLDLGFVEADELDECTPVGSK